MKTKALISCAVTGQLICVFVFAYAKSRFSHNEAHLILNPGKGERSGSGVECRTPEPEFGGSRPTSTMLCT